MERGIDSVKAIQVVEAIFMRGNGAEAAPARMVTQYWSLEGQLLAEVDPLPKQAPTCSWGTLTPAEQSIIEAEAELDRAERAGGDAPHRCLSLADRIRVLASPPPPKPPEPQVRIVKEGHIPPRTDGHVLWWRRLVSVLGYVEGGR